MLKRVSVASVRRRSQRRLQRRLPPQRPHKFRLEPLEPRLLLNADILPPVVSGTSITEGAILEPGPVAITVDFSEDLQTADLGTEDIALTEAASPDPITIGS